MPDFVLHWLDFFKQTLGLQVRHYCFSPFYKVQTGIFPAVFVNLCIRSEDINHLKVVAKSDFVVIRVMGGRNLQKPGTLPSFYIVISNNLNCSSGQRQNNHLADQFLCPLVLWIYRHSRIAQHRFRPRCSNRYKAPLLVAGRGIDQRILDVIEIALYSFVDNLIISYGCLQNRVPVHQPFTSID